MVLTMGGSRAWESRIPLVSTRGASDAEPEPRDLSWGKLDLSGGNEV